MLGNVHKKFNIFDHPSTARISPTLIEWHIHFGMTIRPFRYLDVIYGSCLVTFFPNADPTI